MPPVIFENILGSDEVGRGCIAGPLVCASVLLSSQESKMRDNNWFKDLGVTDSKKLSHIKIKNIAESIAGENFFNNTKNAKAVRKKNYYFFKRVNSSVAISVAVISVDFISKHNILKSSLHGMRNSGQSILNESDVLSSGKVFWVVDGNKVWRQRERENLKVVSVIQGDSKVPVVGAASIIAKHFRDKLMIELSETYRGYGLDRNFGYPTKLHREAIRKVGICDIHRQSFQLLKET